MKNPERRPCALAIGGLDPGGGAGLGADLRAFAAAGVFGCAAASVVTVQSTAGLVRSRALPAREVVEQARCVLRNQDVRAIKIGALGSEENVRAVARLLGEHPELPVVVDPVMIPTRGRARLLSRGAVSQLATFLFPRATLVTANALEAATLTGAPVTTLAEARAAARTLLSFGAGAVLLKGGHLNEPSATDTLAIQREDGTTEFHLLRGTRVPLLPFHGGGCLLASLIAGRLANTGGPLVPAVRWAKRAHRRALLRPLRVGEGLLVLSP